VLFCASVCVCVCVCILRSSVVTVYIRGQFVPTHGYMMLDYIYKDVRLHLYIISYHTELLSPVLLRKERIKHTTYIATTAFYEL